MSHQFWGFDPAPYAYGHICLHFLSFRFFQCLSIYYTQALTPQTDKCHDLFLFSGTRMFIAHRWDYDWLFRLHNGQNIPFVQNRHFVLASRPKKPDETLWFRLAQLKTLFNISPTDNRSTSYTDFPSELCLYSESSCSNTAYNSVVFSNDWNTEYTPSLSILRFLHHIPAPYSLCAACSHCRIPESVWVQHLFSGFGYVGMHVLSYDILFSAFYWQVWMHPHSNPQHILQVHRK